ncbi:hypothetical protein [Paludisphaera soli]|uniref:hypothetical protein n=1 Tax=Paludisphaera soli TaxID=2712865 RepID=UPI0013EBEB3F|nr:hypothetical protein [Paludisphaera soli]
MFRLRDAVAAVALVSSGIGCATFCDECDDFPVPGRYAAIPGSYTGPPLGGDSHHGQFGTTSLPSPTATRESNTTPAPPSGDDTAGEASENSPSEGVSPPPPPSQSGAAPFAPTSGDAPLPQLP